AEVNGMARMTAKPPNRTPATATDRRVTRGESPTVECGWHREREEEPNRCADEDQVEEDHDGLRDAVGRFGGPRLSGRRPFQSGARAGRRVVPCGTTRPALSRASVTR